MVTGAGAIIKPGLAPEERAEQAALRQEYIAAYRASLTAQLDNTYIQ